MRYSRKETYARIEDMKFPGPLKKQQVDFPRVNQKLCRICRGNQEKIMRNFQRSWFLTLKFASDKYNFVEFLGLKLCFVWNFQGYSKKSKNSRFFFQKIVFLIPLFGFSLQQPITCKALPASFHEYWGILEKLQTEGDKLLYKLLKFGNGTKISDEK